MKLTDLIQALTDNPDDLTVIPTMRELAIAQEQLQADYEEKIANLSETNRKLVSMVPIMDSEPEQIVEEEQPPLTMEDASKALENIILGGK